MSGLVGNPNGGVGLQMKDRRLVPSYQVIRRHRDFIKERHSATLYPGGFVSDYWPGSRGFTGDLGADVSMREAVWSRPLSRLAHGMSSRVGFPGVTRDQYGAPLAACTVILHRTATNEFVYQGVSGADGAFLAQSVYAGENHYIVFHKAGAVNVFGATDNNLIGA
jgi:hypothetical protein